VSRLPFDCRTPRRNFFRRAVLLSSAAVVGSCEGLGLAAPAEGPTPAADWDFARALRPAPRRAKFALDDWYVWCGAPARTDDGVYHLLYSRWPRALGHYAWVTHSEVGHATADSPLGPFKPQGVALKGSGGDCWDAHCIHNPTLLRAGKKFYLYYMGNRGTGEYAAGPRADERALVRIDDRWWNHRNNQRIGVAVADHPAGPWKRFDKPLIDVDPTPGSWNHLIASNPTVAQGPDGKFLMFYKTVADGKRPFGGAVLHAAATADDPLGPFKKHPEPVLRHPTVKFPAEDPFLWHQGGRYRLIIKDHNAFIGRGTCLALMHSADGIRWEPAQQPLVAKPPIRWDDGTTEPIVRMERPQLLIENGVPTTLYVACDWDNARSQSCNIALPLKWS
jgi:hypothetical protein